MKRSDITGVILAGGLSKRFGSNKAFATFKGEPLIERTISVMSSVFEETILVANQPEQFEHLPLPTLKDEQPYKGPLGGIVTAMKQIRNEKICVVACDLPLLDSETIRNVIEPPSASLAIIPVYDEKPQYLTALYSRKLLEPLSDCLNKNRLSLRDFFKEREGVTWLPLWGKPFTNLNRKKELEVLEERYAD